MLPFVVKPQWCALVIIGVVLVGYGAQSELRAQRTTKATEPSVSDELANECFDCQQGRIMIPRTGDPVTDEAHHEAYRQMYRERKLRQMEEFKQEHSRKREIWQGTTAVLSQRYDVSDAQRESAAGFVELFAKQDPPAPDGRRQHFAEFLQTDSPDRCVGWDYQLKSAEEVEDGWLVEAEVLSKLMAINWNYVVTFRSTNEVWHVSRDGKLTPVEVAPGEQGILGRG